MVETPDSNPAQGAASWALEEENRALRERLESGSTGDAELKLMHLAKVLRQENLRQAGEVENLVNKNIELVFQVQESEHSLDQAQSFLEEARREGVRASAQLEELQAQADCTLRSEIQRLEGEWTARLEEARQAAQVQAGHLEEELARVGAEAEATREALATSGEACQSGQIRIEELEGSLADALSQLSLSAVREAEAAGQMTRQAEQLRGLESELAAACSESDGFRARLAETEGELAGLHGELQARSAEVERFEGLLAAEREQSEGRAGELAAAVQEKEKLEAELETAGLRAESLEQTLRQVREQFLQRIEQPSRPARPPEEPDATPDRAMVALMQSLLGPSGPVLVQRVYGRCGVDQASRAPEEHLRVLASLEETAVRLLSTPEKRSRLVEHLERLRASLSALSEQAQLLPEESQAPVAEAPVEESQAPVAEAPVEESQAPVAEAPVEESQAPVAEAPAEESQAPVAEAPVEESQAPVAEAPVEESQAPVAEAPVEESQAPVAEAPVEDLLASEIYLHSEDDGLPLRPATDPSLCRQIQEGMKLLALEKFDSSWDLFQKLVQAHPDVMEVQEGLFYNYFGSFGFSEALEIGRRLIPAAMDASRRARFVKAMHSVLIQRLNAVRDAGERKMFFLNLAEIYLTDPPQALDFLARARQIPGPSLADARIHYYSLRLQAGDPVGQFQDVLGALEGLADHVELFDDLDRASGQERNRVRRPAAEVVLALVRRGREAGAAAEKKGGERVAPLDPDPALVEAEHSDLADQIVEFLLNRLLPRAEMAISFPDPEFSALLEDSKPAPVGWKPAGHLDRLSWRLFRLKNVQAHLYSGAESFWFRAVPEPTPQVLFHPDVATLPAAEQQGLVLRALFHLHHRHIHLQRAAQILDNPLRCRLLGLTRDVVQETGTGISDSLGREIDALDPERPDLDRSLHQMLGRLYEQCLREEFLILRDFFTPGRLFTARLEGSADRFVSRIVGLTVASYGIARQELGRLPLFEEVERQGFRALYTSPFQAHRVQRLRLQRLWLSALR